MTVSFTFFSVLDILLQWSWHASFSLFEFFSSLIHFYIGLYLEFCRFSSHDGIAVLSQISWALLWVFGYDIFLCAFPVVWGLLTDPAPCVPLPTSPSMPWQWYVSCASLWAWFLCGTLLGFDHVLAITCKWNQSYLCSVCLTGLSVSLSWPIELLKTAWFHCVWGWVTVHWYGWHAFFLCSSVLTLGSFLCLGYCK